MTKRTAFAAAGLCAAAVLGCDPVIVDLTPPPGATSGGPGNAAILAMNALAWKASDAQLSSAIDPDPDALVLSFASFPQTVCEHVVEPDGTQPCPRVDQKHLVLVIPPALNQAGLIALDDARVQSTWSTYSADCSGGWSGWGSYGGTLEILSGDASAVTLQLSGTNLDIDGHYIAARCGTPPPFVPAAAVAVRGSSLAGDPSSGTGPVADPDALYLYLGTTPGTCADPKPVVDCTENSQMVLRLPPALQVPGEVALNDPQVGAVFNAPWNACATSTPDAATMTIVSASATALTVRVFGSGVAALDGEYEVTICP